MQKKSLTKWLCTGGEDLFLIGKNFLKPVSVKFQQMKDDEVVWSKEAIVDTEYLQQVRHKIPVMTTTNSSNVNSSTALQRQKAVSAYFTSKQILPFAFSRQSS